LIQNALDATVAGPGHVKVAVAAHDHSIWFVVSDDGPGLNDQQRAQLFVPGFTTKTNGSGLGLTIVERIVSDHQGTIEVESAPGSGTSFVIQLPMKPKEQRMPSILIVDDEANTRSTRKGALSCEGCQVDDAASVAMARTLLREASDVVLLDVWFPGENGLELLEEIRRGAPETTVVMMSGHANIEAAVQA